MNYPSALMQDSSPQIRGVDDDGTSVADEDFWVFDSARVSGA